MIKITVKDKIKKILEKEIAPMLAMHGGRVKFVDFREGVVEVTLQGACSGCALSQLTLKEGIERILKLKISSVKRVDNVGL
ncbi:MAG: NifU family protein [Candidatus Niyogibacteria bacterium]|nr:NifU family protein [Candidatus Niyogibacteria bacterium]